MSPEIDFLTIAVERCLGFAIIALCALAVWLCTEHVIDDYDSGDNERGDK